MNDDRRESFLGATAFAATRDAYRQRVNAALVDAARAIRAARDRVAAPPPDAAATLDRCDALLRCARDAAASKSFFVAYDCLQQIEREMVALMNESERRAAFAVYRAESAAKLDAWRRDAARSLAEGVNDDVPSVAALQALMRNVHTAQQNRQHKIDLARRQIAALTVLLVAAVVFFGGWALAGGFEWILHEDVEATLAMMLVNGVLFGFLGGLLSAVFGLTKIDRAGCTHDLRGHWTATIARPFVGAAVAIPIAFFLQSGLLNLGNVTPALDLALCFIGGFSERWFVAQIDRIAGRTDP